MSKTKTSKTAEAEKKNRKNKQSQTESQQGKNNIDFEKILNPTGNPFEAMDNDDVLCNIIGSSTSEMLLEEIEGSDDLYVMRIRTPAGTTAKIIKHVNGSFFELVSTSRPN